MLQVEVFADDPAVMQHSAVFQAQGRDLADRVAVVELVVAADRGDVHPLQRNALKLPGFVQHDHHLAHEWRQR
ncbi:hypothetical protein D3C73_1456250 [compost metagenome]